MINTSQFRIRSSVILFAFFSTWLSCLSTIVEAQAAVVGLWRFNEESGPALDSSGNGNHGVFVGVNASRVPGQGGFGTAAQFLNDFATSSYVAIPGDFSLLIGATPGTPWSIAAWANEYDDGFGDYVSQYGTIVHYPRTSSTQHGFRIQSGALGDDQAYLWHDTNANLRHGTGEAYVPSNNFNTWTHHTTVYDGSNLLHYINGVEQVSFPVGSQSISYNGYNGTMQIGATTISGPSRNWNGAIDDVAIFNTALSPADIGTIMSGDFTSFINPLPQPATVKWAASTFGQWDTKASWDPLVVPSSTGTTVVFGNSTTQNTTVVNDGAISVKGVEFNHTLEYAIAGYGSITIDSGGVGSGSIQVFNAGGAVRHEFQQPVILASNTNVNVASSTVLDFDYPLQLGTRTMTISGSGVVNINNGAATGTTGNVVNTGNLGGAGTVAGNLQNLTTGTLLVDISGNGPFDVVGLNVLGTATLGGTLDISLQSGFTPTAGDTFTVLTANSIVDSGLVLDGDSAGFTYSIVGGNSLVLSYLSSGATDGDFNNDGIVDGSDFLLWQRGGSPTPLSPGDLSEWENNFGTSAMTSAANVVPEPGPSSLIMMAVIFGASLMRRQNLRTLSWNAVPFRNGFFAWGSSRGVCGSLPSACLIGLLFCLTPKATATELIFSFDWCGSGASPGTCNPASNNFTLVGAYGDRVASTSQVHVPTVDQNGVTQWYNFYYGESGEGFTPNVVVDYWAPTSPPPVTPNYRYWNSQGGFTDAVFPNASLPGPATWAMIFTADPGVEVQIDSLQVSRSGSADPANITVKVIEGNDPLNSDPNALLWSSGSLQVNPNSPHTFTPSGSANTVSLVYEFGEQVNPSGPLWSWALDNIRFRQIGEFIPTSAEWQLDGSGIWSGGSNWLPDASPNIIADGNDRTAVFGSATTKPTTIALDKNITLNTLELNHTHSYNLAGTGALTMAANSGNSTINVFNAGESVIHRVSAELSLGNDTNVILDAGTTLEINNRLNLNSHDLIKSGAGTLTINNVVNTGGGALSLLAGLVAGSGTIAGNVDNVGATISPGNSPGTLTVQGDLIQSPLGKILIEIGGSTPGVSYDVLKVGGTALLDGTLEVVFLDDFFPSPGDQFDIFGFANVMGTFSELVLPSGINWNTSQLLSQGTLSVTAVPEPTSCLLWLSALLACNSIRRRFPR